IMDQVPFSV
nr:Chain C, epitope of Melanocyte protein Pmel 17 [synthetic construct]1TVH_F Chain F, epitope of Melanocyte protein Pmel 17 [synthetic construct]6VM8_C Chain C, Melanocyte protein PMEL [Homo sapiens]6VM9_C Chain C, Melanocyte protein PMEL [Homo sapiens]